MERWDNIRRDLMALWKKDNVKGKIMSVAMAFVNYDEEIAEIFADALIRTLEIEE